MPAVDKYCHHSSLMVPVLLRRSSAAARLAARRGCCRYSSSGRRVAGASGGSDNGSGGSDQGSDGAPIKRKPEQEQALQERAQSGAGWTGVGGDVPAVSAQSVACPSQQQPIVAPAQVTLGLHCRARLACSCAACAACAACTAPHA